VDHLNASERVAIGKAWEDRVRHDLNTKYGYNLRESTFHEDCKEKTDCWMVPKSGKPLRSAIKVRLNKYGLLEENKTDILVSLYDPFCGTDHPDNKQGRDMVYEYALYVSVIRGQHRVINGKTIHKICYGMLEEGKEKINKLKPESKGRCSKLVFSSSNFSGCEIWLHYDAKSGIPKLLAFIKPEALKKGKEIKYHDFIYEE
jgi:hypothetical protein